MCKRFGEKSRCGIIHFHNDRDNPERGEIDGRHYSLSKKENSETMSCRGGIVGICST